MSVLVCRFCHRPKRLTQKCICCCSICAASMSIDTKRQCVVLEFFGSMRCDERQAVQLRCIPSVRRVLTFSISLLETRISNDVHDMSPYIILNYTTTNLLLINFSLLFPHPLWCASRRNLFKCSSLVVEFCVFGKGSTDLFDKRCALSKWRKQQKKKERKMFRQKSCHHAIPLCMYSD